MKKIIPLLLIGLICAGCSCCKPQRQCEADSCKADTPEAVLKEVARLFSEGRVGYAADLYMAEGGSWNGYTRDEFVATENILLATRQKDLRVIFEQAQFLDDSGVDAVRAAELIKEIPKLSEEKKAKVFAECQKLYDRAQQTFKIVGTMQIKKKVPITCNSVALVFEEESEKGEEYTFVAVLVNRDKSWKITDIFLSSKD